jgi:histidyl-tRNA synthetase
VAAGGRYDGLIADLGGPQLPGIGFAMGVERVALLLADQEFRKRPDLFIVALGEEAQREAFRLMIGLQRRGVSVAIDYEGKSLKSQLRRADKFKSRFTLIIGEDELAKGRGAMKEMDAGTQDEVPLSVEEISERLKSRIKSDVRHETQNH